MSDLGILTAVEAELVTAIATPGITGVSTVSRAMSANDLIRYRDLRDIAVGVSYVDARRDAEVGNSGFKGIGHREMFVQTTWNIALRRTSLRLQTDSTPRGEMIAVADTIRDRVHFLQSAQRPGSKFLFVEEQFAETEDGLLVYVAAYNLLVSLGV